MTASPGLTYALVRPIDVRTGEERGDIGVTLALHPRVGERINLAPRGGKAEEAEILSVTHLPVTGREQGFAYHLLLRVAYVDDIRRVADERAHQQREDEAHEAEREAAVADEEDLDRSWRQFRTTYSYPLNQAPRPDWWTG